MTSYPAEAEILFEFLENLFFATWTLALTESLGGCMTYWWSNWLDMLQHEGLTTRESKRVSALHGHNLETL